MELYYSFSVLIVLASIFSYLNIRYLKLPSTIGVMLIAMFVSTALVILGNIYPALLRDFSEILKDVNFTEVVMGAMLNFLLFAGAIHVNLGDLREQKLPVIIFSSVSVVISTFAIGSIFFYVLPYLSINLPLIYCLLFGALISPTDPIAVLGILKDAKVPKSLETKVAGESLFNDGVAVVVFAVILKLTQGADIDITFQYVAWLFIKEAFGGLLLGAFLGVSAAKFMRKVDDYKVSVLITLSVVMGGYLVARGLHISGPLTMVSAGLVLGNYGDRIHAMTPTTSDYLNKFWELIDEILNAILFLFIGFELLLIPKVIDYWAVGVVAIMVVLMGRFLSIFIPAKMIPFNEKFDMPTIRILVWGGLRGGVSIALALSIGGGPYKELIIAITYFVVVFSIVVQGLTIGNLANRTLPKEMQ
ncbi:sodium/proton antiporter, CPA1 family [Pseudopedobacter saltans DSM 12145]|uniref:Sodium/proton antiporter, CPA1 family n=1 Tax=Pseudopedobacter saltans (strain ATCC 51119 / DSM 12145 / JCM 21818 / CCUG 39354 / LMG 10337 / NBRC 100064 / NCIMB 13643) TaxID=762903 RepID=F0SA17_PSESL|nr:sodium:proton antiporter [Pseudopedobacter saltans]ADY53581.1 sodium/proton antiporter, CPA1 family [Pseudopedobacter saltans DSM 12145]